MIFFIFLLFSLLPPSLLCSSSLYSGQLARGRAEGCHRPSTEGGEALGPRHWGATTSGGRSIEGWRPWGGGDIEGRQPRDSGRQHWGAAKSGMRQPRVAVESGGWRPQVAAESCGRRRVRQQEEIFFVPDYCVAQAGREGKGMHLITKKNHSSG
jgi:hypothetical protein